MSRDRDREARRAFRFAFLVWWGGLFLAGCDRERPRAPEEEEAALVRKEGPGVDAASRDLDGGGETLLNEATSAYAAKLLLRERELLVTTPTHLFRFIPGKKAEKVARQLAHLPTLYEDSIAFFRDGEFWALSLSDLQERAILKVEAYPQYLLVADARLVWLSHNKGGPYFIQTESTGSAKTLYTSTNELTWPVLHDEIVYFLEHFEKSWKIGRAPLDGREVSFGKRQKGRVPPMLAAGHDGIYFYDGPSHGVRISSFDLAEEGTISEGTICAPLAVSDRVLCAQVGGVIDIARRGAEPRTIAKETGGPITDIAATESDVYWIVDRGKDRMSVRSSPLPPL